MVSSLFLFNFRHLGSYPNISQQAGALAVDKVSTARSLKEAKRVLSEALWPFGTDIWLSQHMNLHNLLAYCIQKPSQVVFSTSYCCKNVSKSILPAKQEPWAPNFEWNSSSKGSRPVELLSFLRVFYHTSNKWPLRCQTICQCVEGRHQIRIQFTIWESFRREKDCPLKVKYEEKLAEKWWRSWKMLQRRALENMVSFQHGEKGHSSRNPHELTKKKGWDGLLQHQVLDRISTSARLQGSKSHIVDGYFWNVFGWFYINFSDNMARSTY